MSKKSFFLMALLVLSSLAVSQAMAQSTSTISTNDADQDWTGISPSDAASGSDDQKTVYLYNVGKKKFLGRGGRWGTECVLSDVGQSYTILNSSVTGGYVFQSNITEFVDTSTDKGYLYTPGQSASYDKLNFFSDASSGTIFYFESVTSSNSKNIYKIYCYRASGTSTQTEETTGTKYYMMGSYNSSSSSISTLSGTAINCIESSTSISDDSDEWILVSKKERHQKFSENAGNRFCHVPGSALIADEDFARNDQTISNWKQADGTTSLTQGWSASIPSSPTSTTYYVGNGNENSEGGQANYGTYMAANIVGASGTIKQTIENVFLPGWYEIRCKAFTTSKKGKVVLYAQNTAEATTDATKTSPWYSESSVKVMSTVPTTYLASAQQVANDTLMISVCIKATAKTTQADESDVACNPIEFGVTISDGENSDITTIDDFELIYRGTVVDKIILDEDNEGETQYKEVAITTTGTATKENVTYMEAQNNERTQLNICEVYLKRTLKKDQWNSIILPLRLYAADIKALWGDDAKVSEFKGANDANDPHVINFELTTDGIYPGKLYLIKPTQLNTTTLGEDQTSTNAKNSNDTGITLAANTANVYKIDAPKYGVDMKENVVEYQKEVVKGDTGKELNTDAENKIQFAGTYFKQDGIVPGESYYILTTSGTTVPRT